MGRRYVIYEELKKMTEKIDKDGLMSGFDIGFNAEQIGNNVGIARNTVSKELNLLCREKLVIKIKSRPVLFIHKGAMEVIVNHKIDNKFCEVRSMSEILKHCKLNIQDNCGEVKSEVSDPFSKLIGYDKSLRDSIARAKAAVLYPPNGLNMMLIGQSGVGKTYFAELVHEFMQKTNLSKKKVPFVYFNCSEYYNNPELLTSHLFGYKKGAFTGASEEKEGLIKNANGGFLFLDEVHRLPSEGQEKLFSIMDKGTYRKLGSADEEERVNLRLICATTEDIKSALLKTFVRRIQVIIKLPELKDRTLDEKIELIFKFFYAESTKISCEVRIDKDFMYYLLVKNFDENVGQLKGDIQFVCAQAYLKNISNNKGYLFIDKKFVGEYKKSNNTRVKMVLENMFDGKRYISIYPDRYEDINKRLKDISRNNGSDIFYAYIFKEYTNLRKNDVPLDEIMSLLKNKLDTIFYYDIYQKYNEVSEEVNELDNMQIRNQTREIINYIEKNAGVKFDNNIVYNLNVHFATLVSIAKDAAIPAVYNSNIMLDSCRGEYVHAKDICKKIEDIFNINCPNIEIAFISLLINEFKNRKVKNDVNSECGVILVAHGSSTATSMADYGNSLYEKNIVQSIDMPIDQSVNDTLDILVNKIKNYRYKKLILLVDIGSLVYFGQIVSRMFNIEVLMIKNVNMLMLLEVERYVIYETTEFNNMVLKLKERNIEYEMCEGKIYSSTKVLVISCITGMGTSVKIRKLIEDIFSKFISENIRILVIDYEETESINKLSTHIESGERIVGIIGTFKVELPDIPFISLEQFFSEEGIELLTSILELGDSVQERENIIENVSKRFINEISMESIIKYITVLNPDKVLEDIRKVYYCICQEINTKFTKRIALRFMIHCCCMVERVVVDRKVLQIPYDETVKDDKNVISVIKVSFKQVENNYHIKLTDGEYHYIYELLFK